jgi:hemin uptake protein HemP
MSPKKEIIYTEIETVNRLKIRREDLPIVIVLEGRKEYILSITKSGGLILNKR